MQRNRIPLAFLTPNAVLTQIPLELEKVSCDPLYGFPQCLSCSAKWLCAGQRVHWFADFHMKSAPSARKFGLSCIRRSPGRPMGSPLLQESLSPIKSLSSKLFSGWHRQLPSLASYPCIDFHRCQRWTLQTAPQKMHKMWWELPCSAELAFRIKESTQQ